MYQITHRLRSFLRHPLLRWTGILFFIVLVTLGVCRRVGSWLVVADTPPDRIDVVGTFAGDNPRVVYSRKLMLEYPDAHWFLSDYKDGYGRLLQKNHFDMRRVSVVDTCKSTLSEITALAAWLTENRSSRFNSGREQYCNVVLVSSPYHMRRIKIMAQRRIKIENVKLFFMPVPFESYQWSEETFRYWWRSKEVVSVITMELVKLGYFMLTGYF